MKKAHEGALCSQAGPPMDLFIPIRELSPLLLPPPAANEGFILTCMLSLALIPCQIHLSHPNAEGPLQRGLTPPSHTTLPFPAVPQSPAQHQPPLPHIPCARDHHQPPRVVQQERDPPALLLSESLLPGRSRQQRLFVGMKRAQNGWL